MNNHHAVDHDKLVHEHTQFTDKVGDAVIRLQDEAYALGRERGRNEANVQRLDALRRLTLAVITHQARQQNDTGNPDALVAARVELANAVLQANAALAATGGAA